MSDSPADVIPSDADIDAERAVLGAMMSSETALADVLGILRESDFRHVAHRAVFSAMRLMSDESRPVDIHTLRAELETRRHGAWGNPVYLVTCLQACVSTANAAYYARQVRDRAARRDLDTAAHQIAAVASNPELDSDARAERAARLIDDATAREMSSTAQPLGELMPGFMASLESSEPAPKVVTGWDDLARIVPGFRPGQMVTIGARPGMGKTAAMTGIAGRAAVRDGKPVLFWSLEMSRDEIIQRLLSAAARVPLARLVDRELSGADWDQIGNAYPRLSAAPLFISDDPYLKLHDLKASLRDLRRRGTPAELCVVDYLQLMTSSEKPESRQAEVSALARGLKLAAKEFAVPVVVGSQLNRGPEARADKRPNLADLRESGAVEQDSDVVILLYRDEVYDAESKDAGTIELHVAKHRNGPLGVAKLAFRKQYAEIANAYLHTIDDSQAA